MAALAHQTFLVAARELMHFRDGVAPGYQDDPGEAPVVHQSGCAKFQITDGEGIGFQLWVQFEHKALQEDL